MRYFARIAYKGSRFYGWQSQKSGVKTVQQEIENSFLKISKEAITIVGCGRTDTGVHASDYYFHFDSNSEWLGREYQLNAVLDYDISIKRIFKVQDDAHARYDANKRTYQYFLHTSKDPFLKGLSYHFKESIYLEKMNQAAKVLLEYDDFSTFCKSGSDVKHKLCCIYEAEWQRVPGKNQYIFVISANRFLRGMVRLIVGMCLHVGKGKISIQDLQKAMDSHSTLDHAWSVPPEGLYLSEIEYPFTQSLLSS